MLENTEGAIKMDNPEKLATQDTQDTGQINVKEYRRCNKNGQSRETGNIGYTRHRTNKCQRIPKGQKKWTIQRNWQHRIHKTQDKSMLENTEGAIQKDNSEKLATQGTQDTGQINVREYRRGNKKRQSKETGNIGYTRHRTNKCQRTPKGQ